VPFPFAPRRAALPTLALCLSALSALSAVACDGGGAATTASGGAGGAGAGGGGAGGGGGSPFPAPVCHPGAKWSDGTVAFSDETSKWGLDAIGAVGVRLEAVDFDADGWPDLVVRRGGNAPDDFAEGGTRQTWLLRNLEGKGFEDVTLASGIRQNRTATGPEGRPGEVFAWADVDNDGDLDVFTGLTNPKSAPLEETSELLLNQGDGTFALGPDASSFRLQPPRYDAVSGASFVDFDRDGLVDLWVSANTVDYVPQQARLHKNFGGAVFDEVTTEQGLKTKSWVAIEDMNAGLAHAVGWSAAACDLDGDGNGELLVGSYGRSINLLFRGLGPTAAYAYENLSLASGYGQDHRADWTDNESARCWCSLHPTDEDCDGVPAPELIVCNSDDDAFRWNHATDRNAYRLGGNSGSTLCADVDNDGDLDLVTGEIVHWDVGSSSDPAELALNDGGATLHFTRPGAEATGLAVEHDRVDWNDGIMTGSVFDFDNDGWLDVYFGNSDYPGARGLLFHQVSPGVFEAVPVDVGVDHFRSHGSAVADFDRDGDLDLVVGHSHARCDDECYPTQQVRFFENVVGQTGNYLQVSLEGGPGTNRAAIGARVTVTAGGVTQTREVGGGHGHYGQQDDLTVHFGLGDACEAEVTVRWPDQALSTETYSLPAGYRFTWTQGELPVAVQPAAE
jgi:hypothetical protein